MTPKKLLVSCAAAPNNVLLIFFPIRTPHGHFAPMMFKHQAIQRRFNYVINLLKRYCEPIFSDKVRIG